MPPKTIPTFGNKTLKIDTPSYHCVRLMTHPKFRFSPRFLRALPVEQPEATSTILWGTRRRARI